MVDSYNEMPPGNSQSTKTREEKLQDLLLV